MRRRLACVAATTLAIAVVGEAPLRASAEMSGAGAATGSPAAATAAQIIATAQQYIGYPYASIGDDPATGFSCIGFAHFVFARHGIDVPEALSTAYASAPHVDQSDLQPGDLVFFQNTVWHGPSHVGLYIGNGQMIAADSYQTGVERDNLSDPYWHEHYLGATRPLADPSATPADPSTTPVDPSATPADPSTTPASTPSGPSAAPSTSLSLLVKVGTTLTPLHRATVYSGPGDSYTRIDTVTPAISVTVVQAQARWVNVSYHDGSQYGWLRGSDLNVPATPSSGAAANGTGRQAISGSGADPVHQVSDTHRTRRQMVLGYRATAGRTLVVTADVLFVRAGPDGQARILRRVHAGDRLHLLATSPGWDYVVLRDASRGWVSALWAR